MIRTALFVILAGTGAQAEQVNCRAADITNAERTLCAEGSWRQAGAAMERALAGALADADGFDPAMAVALNDAQGRWVAFRDGECAAEAMLGEGGSMTALLQYYCLARLTQARTDDLTRIFDGG